MSIRNNEATHNRPFGDRILSAPYVFINLPSYLGMIKEEKAWFSGDRNSITVFKGDGLTIILTALKEEAVLENVQAEGFTTLQLLQGDLVINTPDGAMDLEPNQMMVFHPSIKYAISAVEESSFLLSHFNSSYDRGNIL